MSFDIEGVYSPDKKRITRRVESAQVVGIIALHAVIAPVALIAGVTKASLVQLERMRTDNEHIGERNSGSVTITHRTAVTLPNQLLSDFVEVSKPENPLISEAPRF